MISVSEALERLFDLAEPLNTEDVPLRRAANRVLRAPVIAKRDQPPFAASAMDGYAVCAASAGTQLKIIGEAPAGKQFSGDVGPGQAVRIFTGAPIPSGADSVIIQEDTTRDGDRISMNVAASVGDNIRPAGNDFRIGTTISAPRRLGPGDLALAASMNAPSLTVTRRPVVALLATGDELVMPGEAPAVDQIVASNIFGLAALFEGFGAEARILPVARDTLSSLQSAFRLALGADLIVTIGGASVGDHDLVAEAAAGMGMDRAFYKVAMRPGKPLMAGRLQGTPMIGLPGNPVSAMVCGHVFILPVLRAMLGLGAAPGARQSAVLARPLGANGPREHYMRARILPEGVAPFDRQDSALLTVLAEAQALLVRPPHDPARDIGDTVEILSI